MEHKKKKLKLKKSKKEPQGEIEELKKPLEEKDKTADEYLTQLQYLQADFENYKKNVARDKENFVKFANEGLILKLLNVLDEFESAFNALEKTVGSDTEKLEGFKIIYENLCKILECEGLKPIETSGRKFDHNYHEALMREESDAEEGTILEEFQKGYMLFGEVIRHSKVKIAKNE